MKTKDKALDTFMQYRALVENHTGKTIKTLRDDKEEYTSKEFDLVMESFGIFRQRAVPATPQQNGVAEVCDPTAESSLDGVGLSSKLCIVSVIKPQLGTSLLLEGWISEAIWPFNDLATRTQGNLCS